MFKFLYKQTVLFKLIALSGIQHASERPEEEKCEKTDRKRVRRKEGSGGARMWKRESE